MKKVLICEDEQDARESLKNVLTKMNYEVFSAKDGQESIELAKKIDLDLVLLDIRMPKVNGIEVANEIRKFDAKTKIIFITAFQGTELRDEAAKYDISGYIVKPVSHGEIVKTVEEALKD